jgi:hypothetical protein
MRSLLRGWTCPGRLPDKFKKAYWNLVRRPDISGVQNQTVQFAKLDTLILRGQRIKKEFRENLKN